MHPAAERVRDVLAGAAWAGLVFGALEGMVLCVSRSYPAIRAAHKTPADVLWVAPLVDIACFLAVGIVAVIAARRWAATDGFLRAAALAAVFVGSAMVLATASVLHPLTVVLLAGGITSAVGRWTHGDASLIFSRALRRRVWLVPAIVASLMVGVSAGRQVQEARAVAQAPAAGDGLNVLLIVLDTVRRDRLGRTPSLTPRLDQLASESIRYEDAWATASWSLPSQASILTGLYPHEHRADWPAFRESPNVSTLPQFLVSRGYITGAFSANAAWVTPEYLGRGFHRFDAYIAEDVLRRTMIGRVLGRLLWEVGFHAAGRGKTAATVNEQFLAFLGDYPGRRFFAYLCYMDANQALHAERFKHGTRREAPLADVANAYNEGVRRLDDQIGALYDALKARGLLDRTIIVVTADHGESFAEGQAGDHDPIGHGTSLYPEQLRVPLFIRRPRAEPRVEAQPVSIRSVPVLITDALSISSSPFRHVDAPPDDGNRPADLVATLRYDNKHIGSVFWDRWQYIDNKSSGGRREELFDRYADPMAAHNLGMLRPDLISRGRQLKEHLLP